MVLLLDELEVLYNSIIHPALLASHSRLLKRCLKRIATRRISLHLLKTGTCFWLYSIIIVCNIFILKINHRLKPPGGARNQQRHRGRGDQARPAKFAWKRIDFRSQTCWGRRRTTGAERQAQNDSDETGDWGDFMEVLILKEIPDKFQASELINVM